MVKKLAVVLGAVVVLSVCARTAGAAGLGVGVSGSTVGTNASRLTSAVQSTTDHVVDAVGSAVGSAVVPAPSPASTAVDASPVLAGPVEAHAVSADAYQAFENLVNDVQDGGGWHGDVVTTDAFSPDGVDGGVPGASIPLLARISF